MPRDASPKIDMLDDLFSLGSYPSDDDRLRQAMATHSAAVQASAGKGDRNLVIQAEDDVRRDPEHAFRVDPKDEVILDAAGKAWQAGRFEYPTLKELQDRAEQLKQQGGSGQVRLWVLIGEHALTDIGSLQAANSMNTLFQVASQFNCLESPGRYVTRVVNYFNDRTQGPRASISAFPGTLLRHYYAPSLDGKRFVQLSDGHQINLLEDACGPGTLQNGYFTGKDLPELDRVTASLESRFESIRVGVQDQVQVALGYDWDGGVENSEQCRIAQVFTSTVAGGGYGGEANLGQEGFSRACRQLLRAAYLGTLLAAVCLERTRVVLTLIGGGVFGNPMRIIWESIVWAVDQVEPRLSGPLEVFINGRDLASRIDMERLVLPVVRRRGGVILGFDEFGLSSVCR